MTKAQKTPQNILSFWNGRAKLGVQAGSQDVIMKRLEMAAIESHVHDGMRILEIGCGNGLTALELARRKAAKVLAVDFAPAMIAAATALAKKKPLRGTVRFEVADIRSLPESRGRFDLALTERVIINLSDWPTQRQAIIAVISRLRPGGAYVMCENSQDGLDQVNELRARIGLPKITPPWHNRYLRDHEISRLRIPGACLENVDCFSSTYYFLSRVVNAWLAAQKGRDPSYDTPLNKLALRLPSWGNMGQGRIWLWRKKK